MFSFYCFDDFCENELHSKHDSSNSKIFIFDPKLATFEDKMGTQFSVCKLHDNKTKLDETR